MFCRYFELSCYATDEGASEFALKLYGNLSFNLRREVSLKEFLLVTSGELAVEDSCAAICESRIYCSRFKQSLMA